MKIQGGGPLVVFNRQKIHGWPDLAVGWRNQIPLLLGMGYRVVCPDLVGFGGTVRKWENWERGGAIVYRIALWHPDLVEKIFAVCTPYHPPSKSYTPLEDLVKSGELPNFGYQLQLASGEFEKAIKSRDEIKQMLNALYGARGPKKEFAFNAEHGLNLELLPHLEKTILMSEEMLEYYADQTMKDMEKVTANRLRKGTIDVPVLFVQATKDGVLLPEMSRNMGRYIPSLTKKSVWAGHWALWEKPNEVNAIIKEWLEETGRREKARSAL
ncbi:MAG: hypothetical protein LQ342_007111 [Letrouitia transgressa]|nr:MAG: hypothetical protein LQ342_007111 [Letrouitia transgressa]